MTVRILGQCEDPGPETLDAITQAIAVFQSAAFTLADGAGLDRIVLAEVWWREFRAACEAARRATEQ